MATLLTEVNSVLGIEVGSIATKAVLFDVVEESYQFIASGSAPSTYAEPCFDAMSGVLEAIQQLQEITGRFFIDLNKKLIIPSHGGVEGVDKLVMTLSCGPDINIAAFGLLNDISLEAANRLARTAPVNLVDSFGINDHRTAQQQADALVAAKPRILIFAGGSDRGATRSLSRVTGLIHSALQLIPEKERPKVLYCGNRTMSRRVKEVLEKDTSVQVTNNLTPEIGEEDLHQASYDLNQLVAKEKIESLNGLEVVAPLCSEHPILTGIGLKRIVQFLGRQYDPQRGVLGIDLGSSHTTISFANHHDAHLLALPMGSGMGLENALAQFQTHEIEEWLPDPVDESQILSSLWQKTLFPASLPVTVKDLNLELAVARWLLGKALQAMESQGILTHRSFEPILVSGSSLTHTASPRQVLLALLDGIQPVGITPLVLDKHGILPILGAAARTNPLLPVQILESSAFINLATVITVESKAQPGTVILNAKLQPNRGGAKEITLKQGALVSIPLAFGEPGLLTISPVKKIRIADVEISREPIKVKGGVCGLVFDARGRPISLPSDPDARRNLLKTWSDSILE